jgi:hypothetical protein
MNFEPISLSAGYPWYGLVNDAALEQGDLLFSCPVLEPTTALLVETDADSDLQVMTHPPSSSNPGSPSPRSARRARDRWASAIASEGISGYTGASNGPNRRGK